MHIHLSFLQPNIASRGSTETCRGYHPRRISVQERQNIRKDSYWTNYKLLKKECQMECRTYYSTHIVVSEGRTGNPKKLYSFIKSKKCDASWVAPLQRNRIKVSNGAKIRNRYNQVPHLTQDTNGKVTNSQKTPQTRAKRSALSQQVTKKHI